jgi:hypothetical protein
MVITEDSIFWMQQNETGIGLFLIGTRKDKARMLAPPRFYESGQTAANLYCSIHFVRTKASRSIGIYQTKIASYSPLGRRCAKLWTCRNMRFLDCGFSNVT